MEKEYNKITSYHYSMYRPPLHEIILAKCLESTKMYGLGLDIGCGTGKSSIALSQYCKKVIGIDPSEEMLQHSIATPKVSYQLYNRENLEFKKETFDIVTFAGSLYYAKSQQLLTETIRVCKMTAQIIVYDFNLDMNPILHYLCGQPEKEIKELYNHQEDFSGLTAKEANKISSCQEEIFINVPLDNMVNLLLSSMKNYERLVNEFGSNHLEKKIFSSLVKAGTQIDNKMNASIFHTIYEVKK